LLSVCTHRDLHPLPTRRSSDLRHSWTLISIHGCLLLAIWIFLLHLFPSVGQQEMEPGDLSFRGRNSLPPTMNNWLRQPPEDNARSEEHTSELQSREKLVCRLLL